MQLKYNNNPVVSVLMSVYNEEKYLRDSIESILSQSLTDFEFIITDDNSEDESHAILKDYTEKDSRIILIEHLKQKRLAYSLNEQIEIAKGRYLARMDGDDIAHPERLEKQVKFLEENKDIGMVGSYCREIDNSGKFVALWKRPTSDKKIKKT